MRNELVTNNVRFANLLIDTHSSKQESHSLLCDLHYHDEVELLAITEGELSFVVNGKHHICRKGDTVFCSPRIPHATYVTEGACAYTLVQFRPEHYLGDSNNTGKYFNRFVRNTEVPFLIINDSRLFSLIGTALEEYRAEEEAFELYIKGTVYAMIALLCRRGALTTQNSVYSPDIEKILPAIAYIEEHSASDLSLDEISSVQNLNPSYFCRLFKKASGAGFVEYLHFVRICKSEKLLAKSRKSILEIAYDVGFSSVSYYNRIFKRYKNCTPTEYRRSQYENR